MKTNIIASTDRETVESFFAWVKTLKIDGETAFYMAFNRYFEADITEMIEASDYIYSSEDKKNFPVNLDVYKWSACKVKALKEFGDNRDNFIGISMYLFVQTYDNKLKEALKE